RLVDGGVGQQARVDLKRRGTAWVVGDDDNLVLVIHVVVRHRVYRRCLQRGRGGRCGPETLQVDVDRFEIGPDRNAVDEANELPGGDLQRARRSIRGALARAGGALDPERQRRAGAEVGCGGRLQGGEHRGAV